MRRYWRRLIDWRFRKPDTGKYFRGIDYDLAGGLLFLSGLRYHVSGISSSADGGVFAQAGLPDEAGDEEEQSDPHDLHDEALHGGDRVIDASADERARRRFKELEGLGQLVVQKEVALDLANRDKIDSTRETSPLRQAPDAIYIDTTNLSIEQVVDKLLGCIKNG